MWLYLALGLLTLAYIVFKRFKYDHWEKKGIPTASGSEWFFGHFKPIFLVKKHFNDVYQAMYKEFPDAPMIGHYVMNVPALMIKDLDIIKTILITEFSNFNSSGVVIDKKEDPLAAGHPFLLKGEEWKNSRNQVTPSLSLVKLKGYLPNIFKVGDEMVKYVKKNCMERDGTAELETRELAAMYSTDVIANAIYGVANNTFENKDSLFVNLTKEIVIEKSVSGNIKLFFQHLPIINWFFPARFTPRKLQDVMVALTSRIMKERVASGEKRNDLIQLLLTQKNEDTKGVYTDTYMSGQVAILIVDLYETASTAISIFLYTISRHPEIQEKLRTEIKDIKSRNNGEFTVEEVEGARYLGMVYNETFRLFSFVLSRECTSDCYVPLPGSDKPFKITKGTPIVIPANGIHRDPKYYPNPEKFDPERFTEEEVAKRPRFSYMPFGEGPKKCIGTRLVGLHVKAAVIKILDNFKLTTSPKYPFQFDARYQLTLRLKDGAWVKFESLNR